MYVCMHVCMYVCIFIKLHMYVCMYVCIYVFMYVCIYEVGATERGCSGSIGSDDTRGYGAGSGDVGKELGRGIIP